MLHNLGGKQSSVVSRQDVQMPLVYSLQPSTKAKAAAAASVGGGDVVTGAARCVVCIRKGKEEEQASEGKAKSPKREREKADTG